MKAPPSHIFVDVDGDNIESRYSYWDSSKKEQNVSDLLKWISDVTIKRRKFRKTSRCSNLLAEAVLSSSLRNARKDLALKQEEKRKKAHEFSYQLTINTIKYSSDTQQESQIKETLLTRNDYSNKFNNFNNQNNNTTSQVNNSNGSCGWQSEHGSTDADVQAYISSLDNFFSELKSIKV